VINIHKNQLNHRNTNS